MRTRGKRTTGRRKSRETRETRVNKSRRKSRQNRRIYGGAVGEKHGRNYGLLGEGRNETLMTQKEFKFFENKEQYNAANPDGNVTVPLKKQQRGTIGPTSSRAYHARANIARGNLAAARDPARNVIRNVGRNAAAVARAR